MTTASIQNGRLDRTSLGHRQSCSIAVDWLRMFSLFPPIRMVDTTCISDTDDELIKNIDSCNGKETSVNLVLVTPPRPSSPKTAYQADQRKCPWTSDNKIKPRSDEKLFLRHEESLEKEPSTYSALINEKLPGALEDNDTINLEYKQIESQQIEYEAEEGQTSPFDQCFETAADRLGDYVHGQPHKLSFENELTFIPKLNALSLKITHSRSSIARRIKVGYESRVAALEEEMARNFTFKPSIGEKSSKIADKLKTDFWTRQKLHTEKQRKMVRLNLCLFKQFI